MTDFSIPAGLPVLSGGSHDRPSEGACFMEYVGFLAGEKWGDSPECVNNTLTLSMQSLNDNLKDTNRSALIPLLDRTIGLGAKSRWTTASDMVAWQKKPSTERMVETRRYERENKELARLAFSFFAERNHPLPVGSNSIQDRDTDGLTAVLVDTWHMACLDGGVSDVASPEAGELALKFATELHEDYERAMKELGWTRHRVPVNSVDEAWGFIQWMQEEPEAFEDWSAAQQQTRA